jgi:hypothetical protein
MSALIVTIFICAVVFSLAYFNAQAAGPFNRDINSVRPQISIQHIKEGEVPPVGWEYAPWHNDGSHLGLVKKFRTHEEIASAISSFACYVDDARGQAGMVKFNELLNETQTHLHNVARAIDPSLYEVSDE